MNSFVIGKVIEPEVRNTKIKGEDRRICSFGLLSGRSCGQFDVFDDAKSFEKVSKLKDGDLVLAVVNPSVDNKGNIRHYLNSIGTCPQELRNQLMNLVK